MSRISKHGENKNDEDFLEGSMTRSDKIKNLLYALTQGSSSSNLAQRNTHTCAQIHMCKAVDHSGLRNCEKLMYQFAGIAIMKCHRLGDLFPHLESRSPRPTCWQDWFLLRLLSLEMAVFFLCHYMSFFCVCAF